MLHLLYDLSTSQFDNPFLEIFKASVQTKVGQKWRATWLRACTNASSLWEETQV